MTAPVKDLSDHDLRDITAYFASRQRNVTLHSSDDNSLGATLFRNGDPTRFSASWPRSSHAADLPHLEETDPTGQALGYKEDAAQTDAAKFPNYRASQHCANCNFFQDAGTGYGPCQLFAGKAVNTKGWRSAYAAKAG